MSKKNNINENNYLFYKIFFMRFRYKFYIFLITITATIFSLIVPYYQKILLDHFLKITGDPIYNDLYKYLFFMFIFAFFSQLLFFFGKFLSYDESNFLKKWLSDITYSKALRLKNENKNKLSVGQSLSIYANDIHTASTLMDEVFPNIMSYILPIIMAPIAIIFILGINPILIFCLIFSILLLNFSFAFRQTKFFLKSKIYASNRLSYVNEWIQNIRIIRTLGWTKIIEKKIQDLRIIETKNRLQMVTNGTTMNAIGYSAPFFINILSVYILVNVKGNDISAGQIFSLLWIFGVLLTRPMRMLPIMLVSFSDCFTSLKRIQSYWNQDLEEKSVKNLPEIDSNIKGSIIIKNLSYKIDGLSLLDNINLEIKSNDFIAIIGEIGSGKSLILQAILNIIKVNYSEFKINDKPVEKMSLSELRSYFCYVPQDYLLLSIMLILIMIKEYWIV
jgi:ABC-type bacteriocin/lantibiotic exporter with double-glycine peptidase domain